MKKSCVVVGGGGHAKVVIETVRRAGVYRVAAVTDPSPDLREVAGVRVVGDDSVLPMLRKRGIRYYVVGLGGVPDTRPRAEVYDRVRALGFAPLTAVHPTAVVASGVTLAVGVVVMAQAVLNPDSEIGENAIVNTGAIIEHDVSVGPHAHICPGARVCGGGRIGSLAFVGAGATLREGICVGSETIIGAGSVVLEDVPDGATVVGVPARIVRRTPR